MSYPTYKVGYSSGKKKAMGECRRLYVIGAIMFTHPM